MREFYPDYYQDFHCLADQCHHSCCIGWEIGVDADTLAFYEGLLQSDAPLSAELKNKLASSLCRGEEGVTFSLCEGDRCPFLQQDGLCELICHLGEGALCQICSDHPRFYHFFCDRKETGIGLCCEEAARLILLQKTPMTLLEEEGSEEEEFFDEQERQEDEAIIALRDQMFSLIEETEDWQTCENGLLSLVSAQNTPFAPEEYARFLKDLERLDPAWDDLLARSAFEMGKETLQQPVRRLLTYFLFRHLPDARYDGKLAERVCFAVFSAKFLLALSKEDDMEDFCNLARAFSAEIEYSDENLSAVLSYFSAD